MGQSFERVLFEKVFPTFSVRALESRSHGESMAKITYIEHNGTEHVIDVKTGLSVMEGAVKNNIPGIDADCGGACACATCHVYVQDPWLGKTGDKSAMEESMLDFAENVQDNSRLSCQIKVSDDLDGLVVKMPESQH
jgi:2Fe-2S ferredoxin